MTALSCLDIQIRDTLGKGSSRSLRRSGRIPAVLYGGTEPPLHFSVDSIHLNKELHQKGFLSKVFEVPGGKKTEKALVRLVQFHPVTDRPLHLDFFRVSEGSKVILSVPVTFSNEEASPGIKRGGVLNVLVHSLEITADLTNIPTSIDIDLKGKEIHDTIHLSDIKLPNGVAAVHPERDNALANIVAPTVMKQSTETEASEDLSSEEGAEPDSSDQGE